MYREEEGEKVCIFGEGGGTYRVLLGGRISPGAIIGWALGWYWWAEEGNCQSEWPCLGSFFSVHFTWVGHSFRGYLWASHRVLFHKTQP